MDVAALSTNHTVGTGIQPVEFKEGHARSLDLALPLVEEVVLADLALHRLAKNLHRSRVDLE